MVAAHEVLAVVFQVRGVGMSRGKPQLNVLLWQRAEGAAARHGRCRADGYRNGNVTNFGANWPRKSTCESWPI